MDSRRDNPANDGLIRDRDAQLLEGGRLDGLTHLVGLLASASNDDRVVRALLQELPKVMDADVIGVARNNPPRTWLWSTPQGTGRVDTLRSRLLERLRHAPSRPTSSSRKNRPLPPQRHLALVPKSGDQYQGEEAPTVLSHEVRFNVDALTTGILYVERSSERPFAERERQVVAAVSAVLRLALGNVGERSRRGESEIRDPLTGLYGRDMLDRQLYREWSAGFRYGLPASLLLLNLDYFKTVNDRLGQAVGDGVIKRVADLLEGMVRGVDSVVRYGGETFAVILPHTDFGQAHVLAERIRAGIERHAFDVGTAQVRMTASLGVTSIPNAAIESVGQWLAASDAALSEAKSRGRNCVVMHAPCPLVPAQAALSLAA
jgi:diguanylate cyclase (GGDEF)-like protein